MLPAPSPVRVVARRGPPYASAVPQTLPLFPLGTVLLPGQVLPLHVFEERYREMVRDLLDLPADQPRRFGVVAIRAGTEVGAGAATSLYDVGCAAELRHVEAHPDGRFTVLTVGTERFALRRVDSGLRPYLVGHVDPLPEAVGDDDGEVAHLAEAARAVFGAYRNVLARASSGAPDVPPLPADPLALSYAVTAGTLLELDETQSLLAAPGAAARLRRAVRLIERETALLRLLPALPSPGLTRAPACPN